MFVDVLLFIIGLICLIKGGDWFVDGSTNIAHRFKVPELLIGATVVSIGTTIPEVMVSSAGAITGGAGGSAIAYGNAIGSVICNTALIAAITITMRPGAISRKPIVMPVAFFFGSAIIYSLVAYLTGYFSRPVGIILLAVFTAYIICAIRQARNSRDESVENEENESPSAGGKLWKDILLLIGGAGLIAVGARLLVDHGTSIAERLGVPHTVIALTFVALGTSLPELVTAITSLIKGHSSLSLGNIIGANLFNLVLVSGMATVIRPFEVPCENKIAGFNTSLVLEIPLMIAVMLIMCIPAVVKGRLYRWQGILLLAVYAGFCVFQFAG